MIRVLPDAPAGVLMLEAGGKLTAADYTDVLEPALDAALAEHGKLRVVLVFTESFDGLEAGALWQDLRTGLRDWSKWERMALVTDHDWMRDFLRMFAWLVPGEARGFAADERDAAVAWAAGS